MSGSYTGDGTDSRGITGVGFQPDVVFVLNENSNDDGVARTNTMTGDVSDSLEDDASPFASNLIESLDTGGFTVGSDNRVNRSGETTHWFAVKADAANMKTGTYTGTGSTLPITGVGFQPDLVWIFGKGSHSPRLGFSLDPTRTYEFGGFEFGVLGITSYDADGFTLSSGGDVNASGVDYHYVAFIEDAGALDMGSYIGDGVDNRSVTGVGFQPELVMVKNSNTVFPVFKTESTGSSPPCQWE